MTDQPNREETLALAKESATPPTRGASPIAASETDDLLKLLPNWTIDQEGERDWLTKRFQFRSYPAALQFVNTVATLSEEAGHHPRITLEWGKVTVAWHTFDVCGLHRIDFILAARIEQYLSANSTE